MRFMQRAFTSAAAFAIFALPQSALSEPAPKIAFMSANPVSAAANADMGMRLFSFGEKTKKERGGIKTVISEGSYDEIVGVACSTTSQVYKLNSQIVEGPKVITRHECRQMPQPEAWQRAQAYQIAKLQEDSTTVRVVGDDDRKMQYTVLTNGKTMNFFARAWNKEDLTVCLSNGTFKASAAGVEIATLSDNGCYKMKPAEFFMKRAIATAERRVAI